MTYVSEVTAEITDESTFSRFTKIRGVQAPNTAPRPWLNGLPVSQSLVPYQMVHVGILEAQPPIRIV